MCILWYRVNNFVSFNIGTNMIKHGNTIKNHNKIQSQIIKLCYKNGRSGSKQDNFVLVVVEYICITDVWKRIGAGLIFSI